MLIVKGKQPWIGEPGNARHNASVGACIRCVREYYTARQGTWKKPLKAKNEYLSCELTRKAYGLDRDVGSMACTWCHLACLAESQNPDGHIRRK